MSLRSSTPLVAACVAAFLVLSSGPAAAQASRPSAEPRQSLFVITDQEGYGTGECLERQGGCGKVIADSFCESKGFRAAEFYRKAGIDDITGSLGGSRAAAPQSREPHAFVIGCR
jgi:hypothetical protein